MIGPSQIKSGFSLICLLLLALLGYAQVILSNMQKINPLQY